MQRMCFGCQQRFEHCKPMCFFMLEALGPWTLLFTSDALERAKNKHHLKLGHTLRKSTVVAVLSWWSDLSG